MEPVPGNGIIMSFCMIIALILSIQILITKHKWKIKVERKKATFSNGQSINFGSMLAFWLGGSLVIIALIMISLMSKLHPKKMNEFPFNLFTIFIQASLPAGLTIIWPLHFISKKLELQKSLKMLIWPSDDSNFS